MRRAGPRPYLADSVYTDLRRSILDREFDAGQPLTEQALSRRFKVSRTPVREALAKLERDRLVRVIPKKGAFIRTVSHDEIRELYQLREALEALTLRLALPHLSRADLDGFEARFRSLRGRGERLAPADVQTLGEEFHRYLAKCANNGKLLEILEGIREQIGSVWTMAVLAPRRLQSLVREHLTIIDALRRGNARHAERLMTLHVRRVRDAIFRLVD